MNITRTALIAIIFFTACNTEVAEPSKIELPNNPEELKTLLSKEQDSEEKMRIYQSLFHFYKESNPELAFDYLDKQRLLAKGLEDYFSEGKSCYNMGLLRKEQGDYLKAVQFYLEAINNFEQIGEISKIGSALNNIGVVFMETGNYEYAKKFYTKTRDIHLKTNDTRRLVLVYLNLGICEFSLMEPDYDAAKMNLAEALTLAESLKEKKEYYLNRIYTQLGTMYYKSKQYDQAINSYQLALKYIESGDKEHEQTAIGYANIGEVLLEQGKYGEAKKWLNSALSLSGQMNNTYRQVGIFNITGRLYQAENNHIEAVGYFEKAIAIADKEIINEPLQEALHLIRGTYVALRKIHKPVALSSYENVLLLDDEQDKLENDLIEKTNFQALQAALGLSIALDNEKKEKNAEMETKIIFIDIAVLLAALVGFVVYRLRSKARELTHASNKINIASHILEPDS